MLVVRSTILNPASGCCTAGNASHATETCESVAVERDLFDDEHEALRASFRAWLDKEVVPHHLEWERAGIVPHDVFAEAGRHGFLGMAIPEQYGGGGVD